MSRLVDGKLYVLRVLADNYLRNPFFSIPSTSAREIHPLLHQVEVVARALFLNPTRILLADVIGLGKTIEALRILFTLKNYHRLKRVLVIVPTMLEKQWEEELRRFGFKPTKLDPSTLADLRERGSEVEGVFIGRMDTLKKDEYFPKLEAVEWDAIIVDEAHRIEVQGTYRSNFVELAKKMRNATVLLLSATPHRGKDKYYLRLLSALDPDVEHLIPKKRGKGAKPLVDVDFYTGTHTVLVHRRTKDDVNTIYEGREVFKPAKMLTVLLKPSDAEAKLLDDIVSIGRNVVRRYYSWLREIGKLEVKAGIDVAGLLSMLLIKRGTSSPKALAETFTKVATRRAGERIYLDPEEVRALRDQIRASLDPEETGEELEVEPDEVFNKVADMLSSAEFLNDADRERLVECYKKATQFISGELSDSKIEFLVRLVNLANSSPGGELSDLRGAKIIVFTEFRDTAKYVHSRLVSALRERYLDAGDMVRILTSENKDEYREVMEWFEKPGVKVLVATDVMSEGLNLQQANVLVNYEVVYSPVRLEQRVGRVWRYGQQRTVYVFNLFYLHPQERKIHDVFFRKIYAITESLGKQEVTLGEEAYLVTLHNTIFDETLKRELGEEYDEEVARSIGALPLSTVLNKVKKSKKGEEEAKRGRPLKRVWDEHLILSSLKKEEAQHERHLSRLAAEFVREMLTIADMIKRNRVYPEQSSRGAVEEVLGAVWGLKSVEEAEKLASALYDIYYALTGDPNRPKRFVEQVRAVALKCEAGHQVKLPLFFVVNDDSRKLSVLYRVKVDVGGREISDVILTELDLSTGDLTAKRGCLLVEAVKKLLGNSLYVDEVHGKALNEILNLTCVCGVKAKEVVKPDKILNAVKRYEEVRRKALERVGVTRVSNLFSVRADYRDPEPVAVFLALGLLPRSSYVPSSGVWGGFEKKYLTDIVEGVERGSGRVPTFVNMEGHYDVYSKSDAEERFIECKGFTEPRLDFQLTEAEFNTARELGEKYWLYLVYGVSTESPVVLAVRNPVSRLKLRKEEYVMRVVRYSFSLGSQQ